MIFVITELSCNRETITAGTEDKGAADRNLQKTTVQQIEICRRQGRSR